MEHTQSTELIPESFGLVLLDLAHASIRHGLEYGSPLSPPLEEFAEVLRTPRASFVTLKHSGQLRGCMGGLEARLPLVEDVARHAYEAAFRDPRFSPLTQDEYPDLRVHVSVLSPPVPMPIRDEDDLVRQLRPGEDGLIISAEGRRATFLPSVWDSLPDPEAFIAHLKVKAGLSQGPVHDLQAWRYATQSFPAED